MPIRLTGLASGLDTETIISALVSSYNYKTDKYKKAQTKLSWKQDAWKNLNNKIYSLYTSLDGLRFSKNYNIKSTSCSDTTKATVTATSSAVNGTQKLNVLQTAQAGYLTGGRLASNTTESTTLAELGYTGGDGVIDVNLGNGTKKSVTVSQGMTVKDFVNSLKEAGVNASYDASNKRIYVSSKETGLNNDFTLTGANVDGNAALSKLGLCVSSDSTTATYESYTKYYDTDGNTLFTNVQSGLQAYRRAFESYETASAQNANLTAAYGYASAYSAMEDALARATSLSQDQKEQLKTLLNMTAKERVDSIVGTDGKIYSKHDVDPVDGTVYYRNGDSYIQAVTTDGGVKYYTTTATETGTGLLKYTDASGNTYMPNDNMTYAGSDGKTYQLDGTTMKEYDTATNAVVSGGREAEVGPGEEIMQTGYIRGAEITGVKSASDTLTDLKAASGLSEDDITALSSNISKVNSFEAVSDSVLSDTDLYSRAGIAAAIKQAYANGGAADVATAVNGYAAVITANTNTMTASKEVMEEHSALADLAKLEDGSTEQQAAISKFAAQVTAAKTNLDYIQTYGNSDAKKIDGQDAVIKLNGIEYTGSSNAFSINGLMITAQAVTGDGDENAVTITTQTDTQGIYDKIKDFLTQYNSLINEITSLYNADSAKGYEPLTDEEKDAMSDTEIEKWEEKIKASLLRRDDSLESIMNTMMSAMSKPVEINGKKYYLSDFGIKTLGYLNAAENEQNAYHIDGDEDDASTKGNEDKLLKALTEDPDTVIEFFQGMINNLHTEMGKKMESSSLSSAFKVYNDKEMASEYSDYTDIIKKWEEKLKKQEDYYYQKFAAMETALSKLQSQTSSLTNLFGG